MKTKAWLLLVLITGAGVLRPEISAAGKLPDHLPDSIKDRELRQFLRDFYRDTAEVSHAAIADNDRVENLVQVPNILRTLELMENNGLLNEELKRKPWSSSYWPMNKGMTASRYADPHFPASNDWSTNFEYISGNPVSEMISDGEADNLAPSEKYDLLLGDDNSTLTQESWARVKALGNVEAWLGICDGWAASSISDDEPLHTVVVSTASGTKLKFFPSDVKALSSLLWAKGIYPSGFIGTRCATRDPARDDVGRTISPACFDNNPGTWHMAVVNQLGQAKRPLIINATYDYEIWNYPVWKYEYSYFNPQTLEPSGNWRDAVTPYSEFTIDKFRKYRSANVAFVAGISMNLTYMVEVAPDHTEGPVAVPKTVHYVYDVELDANLNIIGGEWYANIHPDFIWVPRVGARAISDQDATLGDPNQWTGADAVPAGWTGAAQKASQSLQPLAAVVTRLVELSHN